jgi:CHAT domain-containing protein/tetratricopeptide (TPR) repeat protein
MIMHMRTHRRISQSETRRPFPMVHRLWRPWMLLLSVLLLATAWPAMAGEPEAAPEEPATPYDEIKEVIKAGRYADAEEQARALLARLEAEESPSVDAAKALDLVAEAMWRGGKSRDPECGETIQRALDMKKELLGTEDPEVAKTLVHQGQIFIRTGSYRAGYDNFQEALRIQQAALEPDDPVIAHTLSNLGVYLRATGDLGGALERYQQALEILRKIEDEDPLRVAKLMNNIANVLHAMARSQEAKELFVEVIAILEKELGPDNPDIALALNNSALVFKDTGDYARARPLYERSLSIREKSLPADHPDIAQSLGNLGGLLWNLGDHAAARDMMERALEIRLKALGPDHPDVALTQANLGFMLARMDEEERARELLESSLAIREQTLGPDHPLVADTLHNLADLQRNLGDLELAKQTTQRALAILEQAYGDEHHRVALSHWILGFLSEEAGEFDEAREHYEKSLTIRSVTLGAGDPRVAESRVSLAKLAWRVGHVSEAVDHALQAEEDARVHLQATASVLSEREALGFEAFRVSGRDVALTALASGKVTPADGALIWDTLVRSRALVLDEMAARHRGAHESEDDEVARLAGELELARARLARLLVQGPGRRPERYPQQLRDALAETETAERALAASSPSFRRGQERLAVHGAQALQALPGGSALLSIHHYTRLADPGKKSDASNEGTESYLALVFRAEVTSPQVVPLGEAEAMDDTIDRWRAQAAEAPSILPAVARRSEARYLDEASALHKMLWEPVAAAVNDAGRVFVVADGAIHLVNFATLPASEGSYLAESGPEFHYVSAERDLVRAGQAAGKGKGILAVGDPLFGTARSNPPVASASSGAAGGSPPCRGLSSVRFSPLPAARMEAQEIARLWSGGKEAPEGDVMVLTGAQAREARFKKLAPGREVLHLATHGFLVEEDCTRDENEGATNPFLLSGIGLAGANTGDTAPADGEDGILTALEVASLDLSGVQWAVLSACETGIGPAQAGEGLQGLRRAFETAGVATLIMSLWPVQDEATRNWMVALYRAHGDGASTSEAVRRAGLTLLEKRRKAGKSTHPFYWGGFVAAGDWR